MQRIVKLPTVMDSTGRSEAWIYRQEKNGNFPARVRLGPNSVGWIEDEIEAWMAALPRGPKPSPVLADLARKGQRKRRAATP